MFRILFLILFNLSFIQTFFGQEFSNTTPQSIMDNGTVTTYNLQVSGLLNDTLRPSFGVESVMININHKKLSELAIYLKAPIGIMTALSVYSGGNDTFFKNTFFKNTANLTLMQGFGDYSDTFKPEHSLAVFNRHTVIPNGQWQIMIYDNKPFVNTGKINNAIIKFSTQAAQPFLFTTSSLPILSLHTDGIVITTDPKIKISYYTIDNPSKINSLADTALKSRSKMLIEIRGNSSSGPNSPKKGFLIRSIKDDGSDSNINLFGLPKEHDFILNNFFGDVTFTKDVMSYDMYRKLGRWSPRSRYIELFINNDYRGVYCVFEKIKRDKSRVDIAKLKATDTTGIELTGGYIFKNDWTDPGDVTFTTPQSSRTYVMHQPDSTPLTQKNYIQAFMRKVDSTLISYKNFSDTINGYRNFIEYKSFIDYIILQEMSLGGDSYIGSTYFYKDKDTLNYTSKVNFGPPWDFNYSWARSFSYGKRLRITTINPWKELFTDTFFLKENWCRWNDLRGNIYSYNSISKYLDSIPKALSKEIYRDYERWPLASTSPMQFYGNITNGYHYKTEVNYIKNYLTTRLSDLDSIFLKLCINANIINYCPPKLTITFDKNGYCIGDSVIAQIAGTIKSYFVNVNNTTIYNSPFEIRYKLTNNNPIQIIANINGNYSSQYFQPNVDYPPVFPTNIPSEFCKNDTVIIKLGQPYLYTFKPFSLLTKPISNDSIFISASNNTNATIIAQTQYGCRDSISLPLTFITTPVLQFTGKQTYCFGDSSIIRINKVSSINWIMKSSFSTILNDTTIKVYNQNSYNYQMQAKEGACIGKTQILKIKVNALPVIKVMPTLLSINKGGSIDLQANGSKHFFWSPKSYLSADSGAAVKANPPIDTKYTLVGKDSNNCKDSIQFTISIKTPTSLVSIQDKPLHWSFMESQLNIELLKPSKKLLILTNNGQMISSIDLSTKTYISLNTRTLSKGIYYFQFYFENEVYTEKISID